MAATVQDRRARRPAVRRPALGADDYRLVTRVRDGDVTAFEAIYDRYARALLAFCRQLLSSRDDAEDALQHSFGAAYRMLRADDRDVELRPWLYTIARNQCLSMLRARRQDVSLDVAPDRGAVADELVDQVQRRSDLRELVEDLRRLPEDQRAALVLFELGGLRHEEIATVLDVRRDKVKALVFQAREGLMRARRARAVPCTEMRRQLATLAGNVPARSTLGRHVERCASCALYEVEVRRQRAGLALILPVLPTVGLKAIVLGSVVGKGTVVAGGGASAGGGAAVLGGAGGAGGGGGAACAGAGGAAAGLAGAGAGAGAGGGGTVLAGAGAGAAAGGVGGTLATAGGAGTVAAALGAQGATAVVAKLLAVAAVAIGGGAAATGDLGRYAPGKDSAPVIRQAGGAARAPFATIVQPTAQAPTGTPAPGAATVLPAAFHSPSPAVTASAPLSPGAGTVQPAVAPAAAPLGAPAGAVPATPGAAPAASPAPATSQPPAAVPAEPASGVPPTAPAPVPAPDATANARSGAGDAASETAPAAGADANGGAGAPAAADPAGSWAPHTSGPSVPDTSGTHDSDDPAGDAGTPVTAGSGASATGAPDVVTAPPASSPEPADGAASADDDGEGDPGAPQTP
jgi:RNA polymerase sigma factor (sigma-70 family)